MAYSVSGNDTIAKQWRAGGVEYIRIDVEETEAASGSEFEITALPWSIWTIVKYKATLTAGTGATINPRLGKSTGWTASTQDDIGTNSTTAAHINDETKLRDTGTSIFVRSQPNNAASDHSISTEITFARGHV